MRNVRLCLVAMLWVSASIMASAADVPPVLGSPDFKPTPEHPVGWRGDGTGRYPGATPPTSWARTKEGAGYTTKGIAWMTPMPDVGVASPIIVGSRIFVTSEVADLVCLDTATGKILWIRSNPEFEGLSDDEKKDNPAFAEKLAPLLPELTKANEELVAALNAQAPAAATSAALKSSPAFAKKRDIEKKIQTEQQAIDKKLFERYWGQAVFGFSGSTPTSDGKHVLAFFTTGVSVCYDLDGNRKWIRRSKGGGSEHGNFASPLLCGKTFVVWSNEMRGYDVETGKLLWSNPAKVSNSYGSLFRVTCGTEQVAAFQSGYFTRISDGKAVWGANIFGDSVVTPIVENNTIFAFFGYPNNGAKAGFKAFKVPASTDAPKPVIAYDFKMDWADDELPVDKKTPFNRGFVASPLMVDGAIYQITQAGGLLVNDAATGELIYRKVLPLNPKTEYWNWAGTSTSPSLAGKYIYLMDNQGTTLILQPGKEYKEIARNVIEESKDGKQQVQNVSTPIFDGPRMYYRTPGYLYCIGENGK